jgi:acyl transferase domain-containing protein
MMRYKTIPKQANFTSLNPRIAFSPSDRITVPRATEEWKSQQHVALINNYGAAGSNVAIALREHSNDLLASSSKPLSKGSHQRASAAYPILLSARSPKSLELYINALKTYVPKVDTSLGALAYNIFRRQNSSFEHRAAFIATDTETLASILSSSDKQWLGQTVRTGKSPVVLCFGGQTGRTVTISRDLYDGCDLLRYHLVSPKSSLSWLR